MQETPEEMPHFPESEEESDNINFGSLLSKAIRTVDNSTAIVSCWFCSLLKVDFQWSRKCHVRTDVSLAGFTYVNEMRSDV